MDKRPTPPAVLDGLDPTLCDRYLAGECTPAELRNVDAWISGSATRRAALREFHHAIVNPAYPSFISAAELEARLNVVVDPRLGTSAADTMQQRAFAAPNSVPSSISTRVSTRMRETMRQKSAHTPWQRWIASSSAMAIVAVLIVLFVRLESPRATGTARTYSTTTGQRATVSLRDGTRVTLAPQTTLVVDPGFGVTQRSLHLTGQAYFDVVSASGTPLTVTSGRVTSRVLGTQFTVRHYANDPTVIVAVQSGRVSTGRRRPVVLAHNMIARVTDSTTTVTSDTDLKEYMEWTSGRLVFTGAPASEVTTVLGRWYGLTFRFADSAMARHELSGVFDNRFTRQEVLQNLQLLLGVHMTFNGDIVTLASKPAASTPRPRRDITPVRAEVGR